MSKNVQAVLWAMVAAAVAAFGQELAAGNVPMPQELRWLVPIIVATISATSPYLKRQAGQDQ